VIRVTLPGWPGPLEIISWLPDHQLHVALTLGRANALVGDVAALLFDYLRPGPLEFQNLPRGDRQDVTVKAIAPCWRRWR